MAGSEVLPSAAFDKYHSLQRKSHMSVAEAVELSKELARRARAMDASFAKVVGLANGALLPSRVAADELGLPHHMVRVRRSGSRIKQSLVQLRGLLHLPRRWVESAPMIAFWRAFQRRFGKLEASEQSFDFDVRDQVILLVDDCIETGGSVCLVRNRLLAAGAKSVVIGVLCWYEDDTGCAPAQVATPDIHLHRYVHFYPWSGSSPHMDEYLRWLADHHLEVWQ